MSKKDSFIHDFRFVKNDKIIEQIKKEIIKSKIKEQLFKEYKDENISLNYSRISFGNLEEIENKKVFNLIAFFIPVLDKNNNLISEILIEASMNKPFSNQDVLVSFFNTNQKFDNLKIIPNCIRTSFSNDENTNKFQDINILENILLKPRKYVYEYLLTDLKTVYEPVTQIVEKFEQNEKIFYSFLVSRGDIDAYSCVVYLKKEKVCLMLEEPKQYD